MDEGALKIPKAKIVSVNVQGDTLVTELFFDELPCSPVAPAALYTEKDSGEVVRVIELHRVTKREQNRLAFVTYGSNINYPVVGNEYGYIAWWSDQLSVAQSDPEDWDKLEFVTRDALLEYDHEHCVLCWQNISEYESNETYGYMDGDDWICEACYQRFIESGYGKKLGEMRSDVA